MLVRVGGAIDNDVVCHGGKGWYIYIYVYKYIYIYRMWMCVTRAKVSHTLWVLR